VGNREALIEGAKTCLKEKGYGRTTARDIATAAGVSLAAIGYHFGSKDALLNEALRQALQEWGDEVAATMTAGTGADPDARERFVATWKLAVGTLDHPSSRALWATQFEVLSQGAHLPELLKDLSRMQGEAREDLATLFGSVDGDEDPARVQLVGSFLQALLLGVVALWMFDPEKAPKGEDLATAIELVSRRIQSD
jgi:AcrR family transcriptional regulator